MRVVIKSFLWMFIISLIPLVAADAGELESHLVDVAWLEANRGRADVLILDASPAQLYAKHHIPEAVSADVMTYGTPETPRAEMERLFASWGITPRKTVVVTDMGGSYLAARLFFALAYHGFPERQLALLDGGMAKWQAAGLPVTADLTTAEKGSFRIEAVDETLRVSLGEVFEASGDPAATALIEALGPDWHFGEKAPFGRPGHIPNSILLPSPDLFDEDKTFKSPDELRKMLAYLRVTPQQRVYTYCGGGVSAAAPFFALKYILGYPDVRLFVESELGWLKDERELPYWTYDAPYLMRSAAWLASWGGSMIRTYTSAPISVVDVRPQEVYEQGHVPFALNVPASLFRDHFTRRDPAGLTAALGAAGVDRAHEAVVVSGGGVTPDAALAIVILEKLGQAKVSLLLDPMERAAEIGFITKDRTAVGAKKGRGDLSIVPATYPLEVRSEVIVGAEEIAKGVYPTVFIASGEELPLAKPEGKVVHVPYSRLLDAVGMPKPAKEIWSLLSEAGVPRYAELVTIADDPGEAAANYYILKLMGWPDVKVQSGAAAAAAAIAGKTCG
jgi:thiosulfate/3-mercaptopyruvate sulfurtransferase